MEKIKLSSYVKKGVRSNSANGVNGYESTTNFYDTEQPMFNETKTK